MIRSIRQKSAIFAHYVFIEWVKKTYVCPCRLNQSMRDFILHCSSLVDRTAKWHTTTKSTLPAQQVRISLCELRLGTFGHISHFVIPVKKSVRCEVFGITQINATAKPSLPSSLESRNWPVWYFSTSFRPLWQLGALGKPDEGIH